MVLKLLLTVFRSNLDSGVSQVWRRLLAVVLAIKSNIAGTGISFSSGVLSADASDLAGSGAGGVTGTLPIGNGGTGTTYVCSIARSQWLSWPLGIVQVLHEAPSLQF